MNEIDPWKIVRWILIVLVAGFIGQFGKTMANHILRRVRERRGEKASAVERPPAVAGRAEEDPGKIVKQRKKELKALAKMKKKGAGGEEGGSGTDGPPAREMGDETDQ